MFKSLLAIALALITSASANIKTVEGQFYTQLDFENDLTWYQFRSDDDTVWWCLTEEELGFIPEYGTKYSLTYNNNGTTAENKPCDCIPEWECECEVYDDEFICMTKAK